MEPVKGGLLVNIPGEADALLKEADAGMSAASWAIRFAASPDHVVMVLSGMSSEEQMRDNISFMKDFKPLTEFENELVLKAAGIIRSRQRIACTACRYCVDGCPKNIAIPDYFKLINKISQYGETHLPDAKKAYARKTQDFGRASDCIHCLQCEKRCPQNLPVTKYLEETAKVLE